MLAPHTAHRRALLVALVALAACRDTRTSARAVTTEPPQPPAPPQVPQLAELPRISPADSVRLEELRIPWAWAGALHHEGMQEALSDPNVPTYVGRGPSSAACAAQMRYARRYADRVDAIAMQLHTPGTARSAVERLGAKMGVCRATNSAVSSTSAVGRYASQLASSLHAARNLADARRIIDAMHLDALRDSSLTNDDLQTIAVLSVIAIASTNEWYPLGARKADTRRPDPRIVAATTAMSDPVDPDVLGCVLMGGSGLDCVIGALIGSFGYWWPI